MVKNKKKSLTTISTISEDITLENTLNVDDKIVNETQLKPVTIELEQKTDNIQEQKTDNSQEQKTDNSDDSKKNELVVIEVKPDEKKEEVSSKSCNRRLCCIM